MSIDHPYSFSIAASDVGGVITIINIIGVGGQIGLLGS